MRTLPMAKTIDTLNSAACIKEERADKSDIPTDLGPLKNDEKK